MTERIPLDQAMLCCDCECVSFRSRDQHCSCGSSATIMLESSALNLPTPITRCLVCRGPLDSGRELEGICCGCFVPDDSVLGKLRELAGNMRAQLRATPVTVTLSNSLITDGTKGPILQTGLVSEKIPSKI